jgi:hypothetical protein
MHCGVEVTESSTNKKHYMRACVREEDRERVGRVFYYTYIYS